MACMAATADLTEDTDRMQVLPHTDNLLVRVTVDRLTPQWMEYRGNSGYFYEYDCSDLLELREFCNDTRCQTIGYFGQTEDLKPLLQSGIRGIDRVIPIGHTMDFDLVWDGYCLLERVTRTTAVR